MKYSYIIVLILSGIFVSLASSCKKNDKDDEFTLQRIPYEGNKIKFDGYFYEQYDISTGVNRCIHFFYRNGILVDAICVGLENLSDKEERFENGGFYLGVKEKKRSWGLFNIEETTFKYEQYYPSSGSLTGGTGMRAYIRQGTILNDTTIHITESYRMVDGEKTEWSIKDEIYHFKQFNPKPDSLNCFVP